MEDSKTVIKAQNLTKSFRIPTEASSGIKQKIINLLKGKKGYRVFTPLNDITLEIKEGDFFGIVGRNGSGKSTLLKTLAEIYVPSKGTVHIDGKLVPFIELGVGFNPDLTGRENVFLNGALLGFSHDEVEAMYDEIVGFAEIGDFMEEKLKNYSSGMQVRLAFSIAIKAQSDILVLDEVLAVGDAAFQKKCFDYFSSLKRDKKTVVLVTHDMSAVEKYCNKAILIEKGKVVLSGNSSDVANAYRRLFIGNTADQDEDTIKKLEKAKKGNALLDIDKFSVKSAAGGAVKAFEPIKVELEFSPKQDIGMGAVGVNIVNSVGVIVTSFGVGELNEQPLHIKKGKNAISFVMKNNELNNGDYSVDLAISSGNPKENQYLVFQASGMTHFAISGIKTRNNSIVHPEVEVIRR